MTLRLGEVITWMQDAPLAVWCCALAFEVAFAAFVIAGSGDNSEEESLTSANHQDHSYVEGLGKGNGNGVVKNGGIIGHSDDSHGDVWKQASKAENIPLNTLLKMRIHYRTNYGSLQLDKADVYFIPPGKNEEVEASVLCRCLKAAINEKHTDVVSACWERMVTIAKYRREYRTNDFYKQDMASKLFRPESNPGAEMYFCTSGAERDKNGLPFILGRLLLCNDDFMDPANHLRAGMFVIDRQATSLLHAGRVNGKFPRASYILDLTPLNFEFNGGTVSGTNKPKGREKEDFDHFKRGQAIFKERQRRTSLFKKDPAAKEAYKAIHQGVGTHLDYHYESLTGLLCLKEAIRLITTNYPELLEKVYFYNSPFWFKPLFAVFSLWMPKDTRQKLVFVRKGETEKIQTVDERNISRDFGGSAATLGGDAFIERAIQFYDEEIKTLPYRVAGQ